MDSYKAIARALAQTFLAGDWTVDGFVDRGSHLFGKRWRWLRPVARRLIDDFPPPARPRLADVVQFILADGGLRRAYNKHDLRISSSSMPAMQMVPSPATRRWRVPPLTTATELAQWLSIRAGQLEWFADMRQFERSRHQGRLWHYHYRPLTKRFGHVRLIESPKPRLKEIQRQIHAEILSQIPVHEAAHGFCRHRSIATFAAHHVGKQVVVRVDLRDFFTTIRAARIQAMFRTVGYPEEVADLLAGLCTNATPEDAFDGVAAELPADELRRVRWLYAQPHLPQGAPTSPALTNLCTYRLDGRLAGLAKSAGATYTRYADDLAFSGDAEFARRAKRFCTHVCASVMEEGFGVHYRKTRIMRASTRQHLAGLVINKRLNIRRSDYDRLKAILTNCIRCGPAGQNHAGHAEFRSHLLGRIAFVESINAAKGCKLRELYHHIEF